MGALEHGAIVFTLSQVVLLLVLTIWGTPERSLQRYLFAVFLLAVMGYVLGQLVEQPELRLLMTTLSTAIPGTFWLFSASLFDDNFVLKRWHLGLLGLTVIPPFIAAVANKSGSWLLVDVPQTLEFVLLGLAMWGVIWHWRTDLVQSRRYLRTWVCGVVGVYISVFIFMAQVLFPGEAWISAWQNMSMTVIAFITSVLVLQQKRGILAVGSPVITPTELSAGKPMLPSLVSQINNRVQSPHPSEAQAESQSQAKGPVILQRDAGVQQSHRRAGLNIGVDAGAVRAKTNVMPAEPKQISAILIAQLQELMESKHHYREMGLTIGQLAGKLELPEYRLREAINAGLGYRNFNDYLNTYRILEAKERLASADEPSTPVLNIALDVGFRSLSSFNQAFKGRCGLTPTDYRKQAANRTQS